MGLPVNSISQCVGLFIESTRVTVSMFLTPVIYQLFQFNP